MNSLNPGDRVRIVSSEGDSEKIYTIKEIKKIRKGGVLYLLKSLDENIFRLYYEDKESLLEKIS